MAQLNLSDSNIRRLSEAVEFKREALRQQIRLTAPTKRRKALRQEIADLDALWRLLPPGVGDFVRVKTAEGEVVGRVSSCLGTGQWMILTVELEEGSVTIPVTAVRRQRKYEGVALDG